MAGLRQRKKAAAMRNIQRQAVALFREHGFDQVTVDQVAEASEVSPSTVYRYFGTKEGLVLHDEYDAVILDVLQERLQAGSSFLRAVSEALEAIGQGHFVDERDETMYRMELWLGHRGVQAAAAVYLNEVTEQVAELLAGAGQGSKAEARFIAAATINGFIAAIQSWYVEGAVRPAADYVQEGLAALARLLADA
ncbi:MULTISPECIES: TetR/AcrR family transcriptional regulator [unclassified Luteococcus]|uniref:TetR/AcrR family transcriptional regulator n=1 Tax=unclassified Luteococcus TaxID=2639923 RepID=UPI00313D29B5